MRSNYFLYAVVVCFLCVAASPAALARDYVPVDQMGGPKTSSFSPKRASGSVARKLSAKPASKPDSRTYVTPTGKVKLFGTVDFPRPLASLPHWLDVIKRNAASPIFQEQRHFNKSTTWAILKGKLTGKSPLEQLRIVNSFWNGWPYREDIINWGQEDYWAIPAQFLKKSGDCEDYAIAKYFTLKEMGLDPASMRLVVLRDTVRDLAHAVLAVYLDKEVYILDNLNNNVISHKTLRNYSPQYSVNESGRWAHIPTKN